MPEEHALALAGTMMHRGRREMGLWLVTFSMYMRPGECRGLSTLDVVAPVTEAAGEMQQWVIVLAPWERQQSTKIGQFDQPLHLDDTRLLFLGLLLGQLS